MKTVCFPSFRAAAEFYCFGKNGYDASCELVKRGIADGSIKIGKFKSDFCALAEVLSFVVFSFACFGLLSALMAWVQLETNCPQWIFLVYFVGLTGAWLFFSIKSIALFLCGDFRIIEESN